MALSKMTNPEDELARDGRLTPRPRLQWPTVTVAGINFDILHATISRRLNDILIYYEPLRNRYYDGTTEEIDSVIKFDIEQLCDQAMNELWNRLRSIAETYLLPTRFSTFPRKAPKFNGFELPQFIANMLSSIGPLRIDDSFYDTTVIYAPNPDTSDNFGRKAQAVINSGHIMRIISAMRDANIKLGTIQQRGPTMGTAGGSFFTTCSVRSVEHDGIGIDGAFSLHHYTRDDIVMAMLFGFGIENQPFEDMFLTVGFVDDENVVKTIRSIELPESGVEERGEAGRHVLGTFYIDYWGIARASDIPGRGHGIYVLGRGFDRFGHCSLVRHICNHEILECLRGRILPP